MTIDSIEMKLPVYHPLIIYAPLMLFHKLSGAADPGCSRLSGGFFVVRRPCFRHNRSFLAGASPAKS
jgi:hypothetical protein